MHRLCQSSSVLGLALLSLCAALRGSSLSLSGGMKFGSSLYLIDISSLSLRSFARLGASVAVLGDTHLGASLSV